MRPEVRDGFVAFTSKYEGVVPFMYLDVGADSGRGRGLVTTAIGDLIPLATAINLPFIRHDGTRASQQEIADEWRYVDSRQDLKMHGGMAYGAITQLRLTPEGIAAVVGAKIHEMETHLVGRFPEWNDWPWQAQMATLSMAWAAGPAVHAPHWEMACRTWDWALAAAECHLDDAQNPGLRPRNAANKALFLEAAAPHDETPAAEEGTSDTLEGKAC